MLCNVLPVSPDAICTHSAVSQLCSCRKSSHSQHAYVHGSLQQIIGTVYRMQVNMAAYATSLTKPSMIQRCTQTCFPNDSIDIALERQVCWSAELLRTAGCRRCRNSSCMTSLLTTCMQWLQDDSFCHASRFANGWHRPRTNSRTCGLP